MDNQDTLLGNAKQFGCPVHHHLDLHEEKLGLPKHTSQTHSYNLMLAISINAKPVQAVVDTAAHITVISRAFADTFTPPLMDGEKVTMKGTGNSDYIEANYCKDTRISIGDMEENPVKWTVLIVNISYPVILVLDFLKAQNETIDLNEIQITLGGKKLNATFIDAGGKHVQIARVKLNHKV